ncbi:MAG: hypothetical protein ACYC26_15575 [Phycisphaerales bacterium]
MAEYEHGNAPPAFEAECRMLVDRFLAAHPDKLMQERAYKALRLLRAKSRSRAKARIDFRGWAAGVIYFAATDAHIPCGVPGVPGVLNREFEAFTGVSMGTARYRAARIRDLIVF